MFFDEIILSKKSWHFRLQSRIFGTPPFEDNFCPYFWLTIFCTIIAPFFYFALGTMLVGTILLNLLDRCLLAHVIKLSDIVYDNICEPLVYKRYRALSDWKVYTLKTIADDCCAGYRLREISEFKRWKESIGEEWPKRLEEIIKRVSKQREEHKRRETEKWEKLLEKHHQDHLKKVARKKLFSRIAKYTKWFVTPVVLIGGTLLMAFSVYFIGIGVKFLILFLIKNSHMVGTVMIAILVLALASLLGVLLILSLRRLTNYFVFSPSKLKPPKHKKYKPSVLESLLTLLITPFTIFIEYVKVFKSDNCPAIKWKDTGE